MDGKMSIGYGGPLNHLGQGGYPPEERSRRDRTSALEVEMVFQMFVVLKTILLGILFFVFSVASSDFEGGSYTSGQEGVDIIFYFLVKLKCTVVK